MRDTQPHMRLAQKAYSVNDSAGVPGRDRWEWKSLLSRGKASRDRRFEDE